jgi:hypothetical protein
MASPFRNGKKARKRYRKRAKSQSDWAEQRDITQTAQQWAIEAMRELAASNARRALARRKKRLTARHDTGG